MATSSDGNNKLEEHLVFIRIERLSQTRLELLLEYLGKVFPIFRMWPGMHNGIPGLLVSTGRFKDATRDEWEDSRLERARKEVPFIQSIEYVGLEEVPE